jgi:hypothetical protein
LHPTVIGQRQELLCKLQRAELAAAGSSGSFKAMRQPVLLVDYSVYKPPEDLKVDYLAAQDASKQWQVWRTYKAGDGESWRRDNHFYCYTICVDASQTFGPALAYCCCVLHAQAIRPFSHEFAHCATGM